MLVDQSALRRHQAEIGELDRTAKNALRREMRGVGKEMADDAKANASWSTRIPGAIQVRTRLTGKRPGVRIRVNSDLAPHGRVYEDITGRGSFRHPVFGDRETWVPQASRPYLRRAVLSNLPAAKRRLAAAVLTAIKK